MAAKAALYLDHLTAADATPLELIEAAQEAGCAGLCLFLHNMAELPLTPQFNLVTDAGARREVRAALQASGLALGLTYPFTLTSRSLMPEFHAALGAAAELGARAVNLLSYDRHPERRQEKMIAFCDEAFRFGLNVALEFYPASQVPDVATALSLVRTVGAPGRVGLTVDFLHLRRSGGSLEALAAIDPQDIQFAQLADGPETRPRDEWEEEASGNRLCPGRGDFDIEGFLAALPPACPVSVEVPRDADIRAGLPRAMRVAAAMASLLG